MVKTINNNLTFIHLSILWCEMFATSKINETQSLVKLKGSKVLVLHVT